MRQGYYHTCLALGGGGFWSVTKFLGLGGVEETLHMNASGAISQIGILAWVPCTCLVQHGWVILTPCLGTVNLVIGKRFFPAFLSSFLGFSLFALAIISLFFSVFPFFSNDFWYR